MIDTEMGNFRQGALSDDERWQIVQRRTAGFDGAFVYAVRSTGVYCRPTCPSRRPGRLQVHFYADGSEAQQAGYRPCLRCQPDAIAPSRALTLRTRAMIEAHLDEPLTLQQLGEALGVSPSHLQRSFTREVGMSPRQYAEAIRFERAKARLRAGDNVTTAIFDAGYGSSSRFYAHASDQLGMTPGTYRQGGTGVRISYTIIDSPFGRLLAAATDRGVCAISLASSDEALEALLRAEYPTANLERDDSALRSIASALLRHLDGWPSELSVPLDVPGTDFQQRVWSALRTIPYGETLSYSEVASAIGQPTATRAVARACGSNRVAIVIPCHRVVRRDGGLGGYRWGAERKQALLDGERTARLAHTPREAGPGPR
ncbi:MAG TPA: bifunctional DNA-binding transcriptional regulator/O6-methylguanine-DNA methyltransferase Ada [Chloroflexota bacterium]|nr:bifunctional DNA-binding transcriptional regulator/O6-methylguanine-DNA methyltransferase Ada [Chloroflexota bacterium]